MRALAVVVLLAACEVTPGAATPDAAPAPAAPAAWYARTFRAVPAIPGEDDLDALVRTLPHDGGFAPLDATRRAAVRDLVAHVARSARDDAWCRALDLAAAAGYRARRLRDQGRWLLVLDDAAGTGQATIVFDPDFVRDLVIEVPHARAYDGGETETAAQGARLFRTLGAAALLINGADRCADPRVTCCTAGDGCGGAGVSIADVAHHPHNAFFQAHAALDAAELVPGRAPFFVQLHVFAPAAGDPDVIAGDGTVARDADGRISQAFAAACANARACQGGPPPASWLCGETNLEARLTNRGDGDGDGGDGDGADGDDPCAGDNACTSGGREGTGRFLHLEQRAAVAAQSTAVGAALREVLDAHRPVRATPPRAGPEAVSDCTCHVADGTVHCGTGEVFASDPIDRAPP